MKKFIIVLLSFLNFSCVSSSKYQQLFDEHQVAIDKNQKSIERINILERTVFYLENQIEERKKSIKEIKDLLQNSNEKNSLYEENIKKLNEEITNLKIDIEKLKETSNIEETSIETSKYPILKNLKKVDKEKIFEEEINKFSKILNVCHNHIKTSSRLNELLNEKVKNEGIDEGIIKIIYFNNITNKANNFFRSHAQNDISCKNLMTEFLHDIVLTESLYSDDQRKLNNIKIKEEISPLFVMIFKSIIQIKSNDNSCQNLSDEIQKSEWESLSKSEDVVDYEEWKKNGCGFIFGSGIKELLDKTSP